MLSHSFCLSVLLSQTFCQRVFLMNVTFGDPALERINVFIPVNFLEFDLDLNSYYEYLFLFSVHHIYLKLMCALDRINKAIWFYTPIGLCLLINFIMCIVNGCYIVKYKKDFEAIVFTILR